MNPECYALLFADRVITEDNGKKGLIGIFSAFNFPSFPAPAPPWFIYVAATNISGKHEFSLNLVRDEAMQVLLPIAGEINAREENGSIEMVFPVVNLIFQKPGNHTISFNLDGTMLAGRVLAVNQLPPGNGRH